MAKLNCISTKEMSTVSSIVALPTRFYLWRRLATAVDDLEEIGATRRRLRRDEAAKQLEVLQKMENDIKLLRRTLRQVVQRETAATSNEENCSSFEVSAQTNATDTQGEKTDD